MQRDAIADRGIDAGALHAPESACSAVFGASYADSISKSALFFVG